MTSPATAPALPSPEAALRLRFEHIRLHQMAGVPLLNPALGVQTLGFRPWGAYWLGVLVTPWFMNLVLFPRLAEQCQAIGERESRHHVFPAGVFEFIGNHDAELGAYQSCSLFSPMFEFGDDSTARDTALASLDALFDPATRPASDIPAAEPAAAAAPAPAATPALSKRDFLFGHGGRRGPSQP